MCLYTFPQQMTRIYCRSRKKSETNPSRPRPRPKVGRPRPRPQVSRPRPRPRPKVGRPRPRPRPQVSRPRPRPRPEQLLYLRLENHQQRERASHVCWWCQPRRFSKIQEFNLHVYRLLYYCSLWVLLILLLINVLECSIVNAKLYVGCIGQPYRVTNKGLLDLDWLDLTH